MQKTILILILLATLVVVSAASLIVAGNCGLVATPCDDTWKSRFNQTFAYEAAGPFVQLTAFWEKYRACISNVPTQPMQFYYTVCQGSKSLFAYGPGAIKNPVQFFNNNTQECLTRSADPDKNAKTPNTYSVDLSPCCVNGNTGKPLRNCTRQQEHLQTWWENPSTKQAYNRIESFALVRPSTKVCLTRVSDSC